ncbi:MULTISPECIES: DUF3611 family protein [unclassified Coleofasciculus]|uniref:DUF3611 family protein n=1 Tax=unclassified Coleofasciculus TaxID=2692782 RepID=UPI00187FBB16|nr:MULTISPECIES: DUF3611 family protein [unclassified Coleofasciculus]MBE9126643.1 DUF3611 family protein [Coleofasciculus sp. LEGE 07081]MBE9152305.1 DUF3611 family protein [Coleofasciculus sp. LEGE 07092]
MFFLREKPDVSSLPAPLQRVALMLRTYGWIALGLQLVLGVVSMGILLSGILGRAFGPTEDKAGVGFGIFLAICGLVTLGIGIYIAFRYTRISKQLVAATAANRPSKSDTLQTIRLGLIVNLVGMLLTIFGAQAIIGSIVIRSISQPTGLTVYDANRFVRPLDLFLVQANINTITAHFVGIAIAIWLFNRINR